VELEEEMAGYRKRFGQRVDEFFGWMFREVVGTGDPDTVSLFVLRLA
jgi:hypothetical protein